MAKTTAPNPFASAKRITTGAASQSKGSIYVAETVVDSQGRELFSKDVVAQSINTFIDGHRQWKAGENMMDASRPTIEKFSLQRFALEWVNRGKLPDNPKVQAEMGSNSLLNFSVVDRSIRMTEDEKTRLASIVGAKNVDACIEQKDTFILDSSVMDKSVTVKVKDPKTGKITSETDTVMNHLAKAIQEKFADFPDLVTSLFVVKPVQQTVKGIIDRGPELALAKETGLAAASRLVEFLEGIKAPLQIKPTGA